MASYDQNEDPFQQESSYVKAPTAGDIEHANGVFRTAPAVSTVPALKVAAENKLIDVQPLKLSELQPSYAQTIGGENDNHGWYGTMINVLGSCIGGLGSIPCCVCCPNPYKTVNQGNVGLITKFGRFHKSVDPGLVKINPLSERLREVDIKIQIIDIPTQTCVTKDNCTVQITSVVYYHVVSPHKAAFGISNVTHALVERTQTTLRHVLGARVLQDVIERREEIAEAIREIIDDVASSWGIKVEGILMKDINFSRDLQESLSMAAQAKRIGESKIIAAKAEVESAKLMRQAADILASKAAMQIRYLEAMQTMAKSSNSKVIFMPAAPSNDGVFGVQDRVTQEDGDLRRVMNAHIQEDF